MSVPALMAGYKHPYNLKAAIDALGLSSGLKVCLDSGDEQSYRSGQSWLDRSGNGYDFFLGTTGGAGGDDPTFNGTPNLHSASEYFSHDGGDFFRYDSANETWMENLHKDNAKFSLIALCYFVPFSGVTVFSTAQLTTDVGMSYTYGTGGHNLFVVNGSGSAALNMSGGLGSSDNAWHMVGISTDEAIGASGGFHYRNGSTGTFSSAYTNPSAVSATYTAAIGADGGGVSPATSGSRIAALAMWEGVTPLTLAQMNAIRTAVGGRFGL